MSVERTTAAGGMETSYGFKKVGPGDKQPLVNEVFHKVANRYDLMNDLMSAGLHRLWKDAMVTWLNPPKRPGWKVLDVAGGTGDIAFRIVRQPWQCACHGARHQRLDARVGRIGAKEEPVRQHRFRRGQCRGTACRCHLRRLHIAFGMRNVPRIVALSEAFRVLKRRRFCARIFELGSPARQGLEAWSFNAIPKIGKMVTGDGEPYSYLVESIARFPNQQNFATMISRAGFDRVSFRNYSGGIAALHSGWKL